MSKTPHPVPPNAKYYPENVLTPEQRLALQPYTLITNSFRSYADLHKSDVMEIIPRTEGSLWSQLLIRDSWTKEVHGTILFEFEPLDGHLMGVLTSVLIDSPFLARITQEHGHPAMCKATPNGLRFELGMIHDEIMMNDAALEYVYRIIRCGTAAMMADPKTQPRPVTVWAVAQVKGSTAIHARSDEEACARALLKKPDWHVHQLSTITHQLPTARAGWDNPPPIQLRSCLTCKHSKYEVDFAGSEVTPATQELRCTKKMTMPRGFTATFCPGWEEGQPGKAEDDE